jgi:hypothetical protein
MTPFLLRSTANAVDPDGRLSLGDRLMCSGRRGTVIDLSAGYIIVRWDGDPTNEAVARDRFNKDVQPFSILDRFAEFDTLAAE